MNKNICLLCLQEASSPSSYVVVIQFKYEGTTELTLDNDIFFIPFIKANKTILNIIPGYNGRFADLIKELDDTNTKWFINERRVRIFAEVNYFGLEVCYNHVYDASEMWRNAQRVKW